MVLNLIIENKNPIKENKYTMCSIHLNFKLIQK